MSVRQSLLAILNQEPSYGYRLRAEFERRTGATWPLNIGQIYKTLDRLERDGLVTNSGADDEGHIFYSITARGRDEVASWLRSPVPRSMTTKNELAVKLAVAVTLPGVAIDELVNAQRISTLQALQELTTAKNSGGDSSSPDELAWLLLIESMIFEAEAEIRWLDHSLSRLKKARCGGLAGGDPVGRGAEAGRDSTAVVSGRGKS